MILKRKKYLVKIWMLLQNCFQPDVFTKRRRKKQAEQTDEIPCHWIWFLINIVRRASSNYGYGNPKQNLKNAYGCVSIKKIGTFY